MASRSPKEATAPHQTSPNSSAPSLSVYAVKKNRQKHQTSQQNTIAEDSRFVPNKVERAWIISQLTVYGAPLQKLKTLEATCARVAEDAKTRHVPDAQIGREQTQYGMTWRRDYITARIKKANVTYINSTVLKLGKAVPMAGADPDDPDGPPRAGVRDGGVENDAQHLLDQAILDYKHASDRRTQTTEEDAAKTLQRQKESRREKRQRLDRQKEAYAQRKRQRAAEKAARDQQKRAAELQNLKAQTMSANAAKANIAIQRRQCEQFGVFISLYAAKNKLPVPEVTNTLPAPMPSENLELDPALLRHVEPQIPISSPSSSAGQNAASSSDFVKSITEDAPANEDSLPP